MTHWDYLIKYMTIEQLGQKIKQKYPQYNNIDDAELGKKILSKYPQYSNLIDGQVGTTTQSETTKPVEKETGIVQGIAQDIAEPFLKIGAAGVKAVSGSAELVKAISAYKKGDTKAMAESIKKISEMEDYKLNAGYLGEVEAPKTAKEAIGTGLEAGASIASFGIKPTTILKTATKVGASGAVAGFGSALSDDKSIKEAAKQSFYTGLTSAVTYGIVSGATKVAGKVMKEAPEKIYNKALRVNQKMIENAKSPSKELVEKGWFGGLGKIMKQASGGAKEADEAINNILVSNKNTVSSQDIYDGVFGAVKKKYGNLYSDKEISKAIEKLPANVLKSNKAVDYLTLNKTRSQLDGLIYNFNGDASLTTLQKKVIKEATNIMRNTIKGDNSATVPLFKDLTTYTNTIKLLNRTMAQVDKNWGNIGLKDLIVGGIGVGVNPAIGILAVGTKRVAESPTAQTATAITIDKINKALAKIPADSAGKVNRVAVVNIIKNLFKN